jgi:hypothetical protein
MRKATRKLIVYGINMVILLSTLLVGVWAATTPQVGFNVTVTYERNICAKVYIATNGSGTGVFEQQSPTVGDFVIGGTSSALIKDSTTGDLNLQLTDFEALSASNGGSGLNAETGEIEFYIFVQNYNMFSSVYYQATVTLGTETSSSFEVVGTNPATSSIAVATGEATPTNSLMTLKIGITSNDGETLQLNNVTIAIALQTTAF